MKDDEFWYEEDDREEIDSILSANAHLYRKEFKDWLKQRPQFLETFVDLAVEQLLPFDPYGYSALALLRRTERKLGMVTGSSYEYVAELGRLLMAINPEFYEVLWRGERYSHPVKKFISKYGFYVKESFYEENPEFQGFIVDDDDVTDKNPDYMVFPELTGLPEVEPCGVGEGCGIHPSTAGVKSPNNVKVVPGSWAEDIEP